MDDKKLLNLFTDLVHAHSAYMSRQLAALQLSEGQGGVISALGRLGSMSQSELAQARNVTPATISIMLGRMERDGLVARDLQNGFGRANLVRLTEKGQKTYEKLDALMDREPEVIFAGLSEEEKSRAAEVFRCLIGNVLHAGE